MGLNAAYSGTLSLLAVNLRRRDIQLPFAITVTAAFCDFSLLPSQTLLDLMTRVTGRIRRCDAIPRIVHPFSLSNLLFLVK